MHHAFSTRSTCKVVTRSTCKVVRLCTTKRKPKTATPNRDRSKPALHSKSSRALAYSAVREANPVRAGPEYGGRRGHVLSHPQSPPNPSPPIETVPPSLATRLEPSSPGPLTAPPLAMCKTGIGSPPLSTKHCACFSPEEGPHLSHPPHTIGYPAPPPPRSIEDNIGRSIDRSVRNNRGGLTGPQLKTFRGRKT